MKWGSFEIRDDTLVVLAFLIFMAEIMVINAIVYIAGGL